MRRLKIVFMIIVLLLTSSCQDARSQWRSISIDVDDIETWFDPDKKYLPTNADVDQLAIGMSLEEVVRLLGRPQRDIGSGWICLEFDLVGGQVLGTWWSWSDNYYLQIYQIRQDGQQYQAFCQEVALGLTKLSQEELMENAMVVIIARVTEIGHDLVDANEFAFPASSLDSWLFLSYRMEVEETIKGEVGEMIEVMMPSTNNCQPTSYVEDLMVIGQDYRLYLVVRNSRYYPAVLLQSVVAL